MAELAGQFLGINRPDLALSLTQHLLQAGDKTAQVYFLDGYAQEARGQEQAAIDDLEQASTLDPTNVQVLAQLSALYLAVNRPSDAERIANRAVTFNKTDPQAYSTLGQVYAAEAHYDDARIQFEQAFALDKSSVAPIFSIAQTYVAQNNLPMALTTIERALAIDPRNVDALAFKADVYARQHDDAHAAEAYDDAAVAAPTAQEKVAIYVRKAQYFTDEHKNDQAAAVYQQLLTQYPRVALTYVAYGAFLAAANHQLDKAVAQWRTALSIDPDNEDALRDLGEYDLENNRAADALVYLKHLTDVAPSAEGFGLLAEAYNQMHQYSPQRDACMHSFQIKQTPETLACIGGAEFELHDYKTAARIFDVLDSRVPGFLDRNPQLLYVAAQSYASNHEKDKALAAYERLLQEMHPGTKGYKAVQKAIADLNKPAAPSKPAPRPTRH